MEYHSFTSVWQNSTRIVMKLHRDQSAMPHDLSIVTSGCPHSKAHGESWQIMALFHLRTLC